MKVLEGLLYTKNHEWIKKDASSYTLGITDYAQSRLGSIVFVDLPEEGDTFDAGDSVCVVESTKAASDIFIPCDCEVIEINEDLEDDPELINSDAYSNFLIKFTTNDDLNELLSAKEYIEFCSKEK